MGNSEQLLLAGGAYYGEGVCKIPIPPFPSSQLQLGRCEFLTSDPSAGRKPSSTSP